MSTDGVTAEPLILFETDANGVATLTLNRPAKYNAFTQEMVIQWAEALDRAGEDPNVRAIIVTGAGKAFCSGGDVGNMAKRTEEDALQRKDYLYRYVHRVAFAMERLDKPVIAAINGAARGAGLDMALMCDIRYMAQSATVAESYINMGFISGDGGAWYLPRLIGIDQALELFWTGRVVGAEEAKAMGLVTRIVPDEDLMPAARELATKIASQPTAAVRMFKRAVYQGMTTSLHAHLDLVSSHMSVLRDSPEHKERVRAFLERPRKSK